MAAAMPFWPPTSMSTCGNMLALARQINVPLVHVSTLSVSGSYLPADPQKPASFCETDLDIGQNCERKSVR